jgi:hypothetical protein
MRHGRRRSAWLLPLRCRGMRCARVKQSRKMIIALPRRQPAHGRRDAPSDSLSGSCAATIHTHTTVVRPEQTQRTCAPLAAAQAPSRPRAGAAGLEAMRRPRSATTNAFSTHAARIASTAAHITALGARATRFHPSVPAAAQRRRPTGASQPAPKSDDATRLSRAHEPAPGSAAARWLRALTPRRVRLAAASRALRLAHNRAPQPTRIQTATRRTQAARTQRCACLRRRCSCARHA